MGLFKRLLKKSETAESTYTKPVTKFLSYQAANLQGIGSRPYQEDSFAFVNAMDVTGIKKNGLLAVLADGMGGLENGRGASELAVKMFSKDFEKLNKKGDIPEQLKKSALKASEAVYKKFGGRSGTTLIVCFIYEAKLWFLSIGDSYICLKRDESVCRLNREQTHRQALYAEEISNGCLNPKEADNDPDGNRLTEFVGKDSIDDIDLLQYPLQLLNGDTVLICSDGVGRVIPPERLFVYLNSEDANDICRKIEADIVSQRRKHQDNYTALVIRCHY